MANIILKSVGNNKVQVIKLLCEVTSMGVKESKDIVDGVEAGNEYTITDIQKADIQTVIQKFAQIGAAVTVEEDRVQNLTEGVNPSDSAAICCKCGAELEDGAKFCIKCGAAVNIESVNKEEAQKFPEEELKNLNEEPKSNKAAKAIDSFIEWHEWCLAKHKIFAIFLIIAEIVLVLWLLFKTWKLLLGVLIIASIALPFIAKKDFTDKDRQNSREVVIGLAKIMAGVIIILIIVFNWSSIINIFRPGAAVRNAYLTQYSENVTIENAFDGFFANGKWKTYEERGNSYVVFTGACEYFGEKVDAKIVFKITGENFIVDSLEINGVAQSDIILYGLLLKVYENY